MSNRATGVMTFRLKAARCVVVIASCMTSTLCAADFTIKEHLGHAWSNEVVTFTPTRSQRRAAAGGKWLVDEEGNRMPCQLVTGEKGVARIAFQVDVPPDSTREFRFEGKAAKRSADLSIDETHDLVRLFNSRIGISLRKKLTADQGPIEGIRLGSGTWTGGSKLSGGSAIAEHTVEVTARGPVFTEAVTSTVFSDGGTWQVRCRVENDEPVVIVEESYDAPGGGTFEILLGGKAFKPNQVLYRQNMSGGSRVSSEKLDKPGTFFTLEPWLHWWGHKQQGTWFAVYAPDPQPDLLMIGALRPSLWRQPDWKGRVSQPAMMVRAEMRGGIPMLPLPIGGGRRIWMLGTPDKATSVDVLKAKNTRVAALPQKYVIKHGNFPLDEVKDYVLEWEGDHKNYPRLFIGKDDLLRLRKTLKPNTEQLRQWETRRIDKYNIEDPLREYFASGSEQLGANIAGRAEEWMRTVVHSDLLRQDSRVALNVAPHNQAVLLVPTINLTDAALSYKGLSPERRRRLLAHVAFLGYALTKDDYWSPKRGFNANPNMTTTVASFQVALGSLVPSHPMAKTWAHRGLGQMTYQLKAWSDEDGGWLEAPHYAMVALSPIVGGFAMATRAGFGDFLYNERIPKVAEWFAKISTPRDVRTDGFRHYPPIGNTYHGESTGMFGILAGFWKERDPEFAAHMQWMCEEHGCPDMGIGWSFPTMTGFKSMLKANGVKPERPDYGSAWFRKTGVVLRNIMGDERETYLHLIAGSNHEHYDYDSGSIVVWGKGRVLADDWGYVGRHARNYHNLLSSRSTGGNMQVKTFAAQPALDYVDGRKGAWRRQIAFAKDTDPKGPNFFLIRDTHSAGDAATWRLWLTTASDVTEAKGTGSSISIHAHGATVTGADDVDLDIFMYQADKLALKTETATQHLTCAKRNGKVGAMDIRQTALVASLKQPGAIVSLLYPRLKAEKPSRVTWFADGRIAKVTSGATIDYVFLAAGEEAAVDGGAPAPLHGETYTAESGKVAFQGSVGTVQLRTETTSLSLGHSGTVISGAEKLSSRTARTQTTKR